MADLLSILSQGANGLSAHRAAAQTAAHNIQNVNTEGYSRQRVDLETLPAEYLRNTAYAGMGVAIGAISQSRDAFLERQVPATLRAQAQYTAESSSLRSMVALNPESTGGLTEAFSAFYRDMRMLSQNPSQAGLRAAVTGAARNVAYAFNRTANGIQSAQAGIDTQVEQSVEEANRMATRVANLNGEIAKARAMGGEPNDLLDQRRLASDRLSELLGTYPVPDAAGNLNMALPGGLVIVSANEASTLTAAADPNNAGRLSVQVTRIGTQTTEILSSRLLGGEVRGFLDARDGTLQQTLNALDTLAFDFANSVNTQHLAGFDLNGNAGQPMFDVGVTSDGTAGTLSVSAALISDHRLLASIGAAGNGPGDGSNVLALIATESQLLSGGETAVGALSSIISSFGARSREAEARAQQESAIASNLRAMRESVSGVSIDEEMVNMTKAQRAFDAVSRVIQTANEMMQTLMTLK
ncbi:MAG: flagellar hook-associated protein FlgK [Myxococcales bacterium]|nr:flagellar hook-associated protein FlgK [Myxococcales bacterium]